MSKTAIPEIKKVKLSDLIIDTSLSGRSEKEINANAKPLSEAVKAYGGWDFTQPGAYFVRDGKLHLARGFTRTAAAKIAGETEGYFVEIEDNPALLRTEAIRSNMGKPISAYEQGRIYVAMRDGTNAEEAKPGEIILAPMKIADIAKEVGYTRQHVENCIGIFESSPEIGELIQDGKISYGVAVRSKQLVKDEAKQLRWLKAAIKLAEKDGKECATMQHLNACREDFAPVKAAAAPAKAKKSDAAESGEAADESQEVKEGESSGEEAQEEAPEQPELSDLGGSEQETPTKPSRPAAKAVKKDAIVSVISKWGDDQGVAMSDEDINALVEAIQNLFMPF